MRLRPQNIGRFITLVAFCVPAAWAQGPLTLSQFTDCIASYGANPPYNYGPTCQLGPNLAPGSNGVWQVSNTLSIGRNVTIVGTSGNAGDVILQRTSALGTNSIMSAQAGTIVSISWLTFDGNRNSTQCSSNTSGLSDVDLSNAGLAAVLNVNFIRAPGNALLLGGAASNLQQASVVGYSNFGLSNGFSNPSRGYNLSGPQTANRWTGAFLFNNYTGAWYNNFAYAGTAAINVYSGTVQYVIANTLFSNRYEQPDGASGGQLYINGAATYASVANNLIDGNYWTTTGHNSGNTDMICSPAGTGDYVFGVEGFGVGHRFFNNQIQNNTGWGILLRPSASGSGGSLDNTVVSGYDPFCSEGYPPGCQPTAHYITNNASCWPLYGCYGAGWGADMAIAGLTIDGKNGVESNNITLDNIRVTNNGRLGVSLSYLNGSPGFTDSQNSGAPDACITSNPPGSDSGDLYTFAVSSAYTSYIRRCPPPWCQTECQINYNSCLSYCPAPGLPGHDQCVQGCTTGYDACLSQC